MITPVCTSWNVYKRRETKYGYEVENSLNPVCGKQKWNWIKFAGVVILSRDGVTTDGFWIDNRIYCTHMYLLATPHRSLPHIEKNPQSRRLVTTSNGGRSSDTELTSLQGGDHFMTPSYSDRWLDPVLPSAVSSRVKLTFQLPNSNSSYQFSTCFRADLPAGRSVDQIAIGLWKHSHSWL
jgi:hypothetical protein